MSRTVLTEVDGWTPLMECIVKELGITSAAVFGRIWRYCQMETGVCYATIETISGELGLDRTTVMRHISVLVDTGYLEDSTPDLRNRPHTYIDAGKVTLKDKMSAVVKSDSSVVKSDSAVAFNYSAVVKSDLKKELREKSRKKYR